MTPEELDRLMALMAGLKAKWKADDERGYFWKSQLPQIRCSKIAEWLYVRHGSRWPWYEHAKVLFMAKEFCNFSTVDASK